MGFGRVFRYYDDGWRPIGEPLPEIEHAPPDPFRPLAPWVLPVELGVRVGDVVVWQELAHQLIGWCGPDSPEVAALATQTMVLHGAAETAAWLEQVEVWVGRRLKPGRTWPIPPEDLSGVDPS